MSQGLCVQQVRAEGHWPEGNAPLALWEAHAQPMGSFQTLDRPRLSRLVQFESYKLICTDAIGVGALCVNMHP